MMLFHFLCALPFLRLAQCTYDPLFEEKTFDVGETVTLRCPRDASEPGTVIFWIRFVSGNSPESLGGTPTFNDPNKYETSNSSIQTKQEPGSFALSINKAQLSDTGFYYCVKVKHLEKKMIFFGATFLKIKGPDSDLSVESPDLSGAVDPGDSVDLQCWVQTEKAHCFEEHMVWWFRSGLDRSSPGLVYAQRNSSGRCDGSSEEHGPHKCFYSFSKTVSPSDSGTYRCAVAACGQILFGNTVEVNVKTEDKCAVEKAVIIGLSVLLTISLIISIVLICFIKRKCCFFDGEIANESDMKRSERTSPQRNAELTYSAPKFNKKKAEKSQHRTVKSEEHVVYSDVRARN